METLILKKKKVSHWSESKSRYVTVYFGNDFNFPISSRIKNKEEFGEKLKFYIWKQVWISLIWEVYILQKPSR